MNDIDLIAKVRDYVMSLKQLVNDSAIYPRELFCCASDSVFFAYLSKTFAIAESCLILLGAGHPDEAFGLGRTLVECAANLRYLTQSKDDQAERVQTFIDYAEKERRYWLEQIRAHVEDPEMVQEAVEFAKDNDVEKNGQKPLAALAHWSSISNFVWSVAKMDHPLDGDGNTPSLRAKLYAMNYHSTSHFVHCSEWALRNYFPTIGAPFSIGPASQEYDATATKLLHLIVIHLHECIRYAFFGLDIQTPDAGTRLFTETVELMKD